MSNVGDAKAHDTIRRALKRVGVEPLKKGCLKILDYVSVIRGKDIIEDEVDFNPSILQRGRYAEELLGIITHKYATQTIFADEIEIEFTSITPT